MQIYVNTFSKVGALSFVFFQPLIVVACLELILQKDILFTSNQSNNYAISLT